MLVEGSMTVEKKLEDEANAQKKENDQLQRQIEEMSALLIKNFEDAESDSAFFRR